MTQLELAKSVINSLDGKTFNCNVWASTGGKCADGWGDCLDLEVSKEELLYLISNNISIDRLFDGIETKIIDIESTITDLAYMGAWPEGGPEACVQEQIPDELYDLSTKIAELNGQGKQDVCSIKELLKTITDGEYTFTFDVFDGGNTFSFAEDYKVKIKLTTDQAIGLLCDYHNLTDFGYELLGKDFIDDIAVNMGIADRCDYFGYGGSCDEIENYIDSICCVLKNIIEGKITEENLEGWMEYFEDRWNFEYHIEEWHENENL